MWTFFWDTFGFIADNVSKALKIFLFALLLLIVFFFFGFSAVFYFRGWDLYARVFVLDHR